ncbi:glycosyltransferase family 9 protein [Bordetella sp. FB-8]|uniref:glycosyltransferase family 9 protein n=1 Tax=Bordetella sp. FB-8 TaxID=1159870 RepID=UPI0004766669|nr:glycosyltransferase family 9 protein [Bordetella sp. FB-8]
MPAISRLYVRLPNWVGDVCMSLPALHLLQKAGLRLTLCARPWARDLLAGLPEHDFVALRGRVREDRATVAASRRALGREGRDARGLLIPDSLSSALAFRLAGLACAGFRDEGRSLLLRWPIAKPAPALHTVQVWHYLARVALGHWGLPVAEQEPGPRLALPLTGAHIETAQALLRAHALQDRPYLLIAPTAVGLHHGRAKVWPHFDALTRVLQAAGHIVAMCPPPAEVDQARTNAPTATLLPPLGLGAYAALAARARLVVCNDSGVSHIAAAVGARQLTLFGVTQAGRTGPWSPRARGLGSDLAWPEMDAVRAQVDALLTES